MANNKVKVPALQQRSGQPAPMTPAERAEAISRALAQKVESIAQGVLYNLIGGMAHAGREVKIDEVTTAALDIAASLVRKSPKVVDELFNEMFNPQQAPDAEKADTER